MKNQSIKQVVAIGVGAALFVVIGMISIPTPVPNTSIQLQYAVQSLLSIIFGPLVGLLVGLIGHAVKDSLAGYGLWWTWIIASGLFGLAVGLFRKYIRVTQGVFELKDIVFFNLIQIVAMLLFGVSWHHLEMLCLSRSGRKSICPRDCCGNCKCCNCSYRR